MKLPTHLVICLAGGWIRIKQSQAIANLPRMVPRPVTRLARCLNFNPNLVVFLYRIIELGTKIDAFNEKSSHRSLSMKFPTCSFFVFNQEKPQSGSISTANSAYFNRRELWLGIDSEVSP